MRYILLALFLLLTPSSASAVWFDSNWDYRIKVEVVPTQVGSSTNVTSFPVYVDLGDLPTTFFTNSSSTGADIRVTESDGSTETAFELVSFGSAVTESVTIDTSTTTFQLPSYALNPVTVEAWGAGGGGGDGTNTGGGGGGGGAYASSSLTLATSTNYTIDIGAGGAKGTAGAAGGFGATTTFNGGQVLAQGGRGGSGCSAIDCAGGSGGLASASVGSSTYNGGTGATGINATDVGGGGGEAGGSLGAGQAGSGATGGNSVGNGGDGGNGGANAGSGYSGNKAGGGGGGGENNSAGTTGGGGTGRVKLTYGIATSSGYYGELHFMADSLGTTSTSTFYIYYGNPSATAYNATDTYGRNNVWGGYVAVWHGQETSGNLLSATGNNTGTETRTSAPETGQMGNAREVERNVGEYFVTTNANQTGLGITGNSITMSAWVKGSSVMTSNIGRIVWRLGGTGSYGYQLSTTGSLYSPNNAYLVSAVGSGGGTDFGFGTTGDANSTTFKHVVATYNGSVFTGYVNNNATSSGTLANRLTNSNAIDFQVSGSSAAATDFLDAVIDELRIASTTKDASWVVTEYNNQSSPSTFFWIGAEETEGAPPASSGADAGLIWFD